MGDWDMVDMAMDGVERSVKPMLMQNLKQMLMPMLKQMQMHTTAMVVITVDNTDGPPPMVLGSLACALDAVASAMRMPSLTMESDMVTALDMVVDTEESPDTQVAVYLTVDAPSMVFVENAQQNLSSLDGATDIMHDLELLLSNDLV